MQYLDLWVIESGKKLIVKLIWQSIFREILKVVQVFRDIPVLSTLL